jgi:replicative DNA helicase
LTLDDSADLSVTDLRTLARQQALKHGLDLLVVDYLQLLRPEPGENRQTEIAAISRGLKLLAKDLNVPLLVLSQLNRSCEQREDKRPILADLRDSGSIEQDADVVLCLYRDEVYDEQSPDKGLAELLVRKQRNGPIGEPKMKWIKETATFEDLPGPA